MELASRNPFDIYAVLENLRTPLYTATVRTELLCFDNQKRLKVADSTFPVVTWNIYDMKRYLLTAIGLPPGASSAAHIYTQTTHRTTQNKQYTEQHKILEDKVNTRFSQFVNRTERP